jgi:hypothetical protein
MANTQKATSLFAQKALQFSFEEHQINNTEYRTSAKSFCWSHRKTKPFQNKAKTETIFHSKRFLMNDYGKYPIPDVTQTAVLHYNGILF